MTGDLGEDGDDENVLSPGEEVAGQERVFWDNRRLIKELDDDEDGRRERRRLSAQGRQMHLRVRMHRYARRQDQGPLPRDMGLPPLPDHEDLYGGDVMDSDDQRDWRE